MNSPSHPELPYHPISQRYQRRFGRKVYKLSVGVAETCPVRTGKVGRVCVFCDEWGSAAYADQAGNALPRQIADISAIMRKRYKADGFLAYFQAYTTTFGQVSRLREWFDTALAQPDVLGVVVGTRPDCLPASVLKLFEEYAENTYLAVELGVQSLVDEHLHFLRRGHDAATAIEGLRKLVGIRGLDVDAHLMFGLPGEHPAQLEETARVFSEMGVDGVKLHNLHVLRETPLEQLYREGGFHPVTLEAYAEKVRVFLEHLSPDLAVHRLSAVASRWEEVVAPEWVKEKMRPTQYIVDYLHAQGSRQGMHWNGESKGQMNMPANRVPSPQTSDEAGLSDLAFRGVDEKPGGTTWG